MFGHQNSSADSDDANKSETTTFPPAELLEEPSNPAASPSVGAPVTDTPQLAVAAVATPDPAPTTTPSVSSPAATDGASDLITPAPVTDDLLTIKQSALEQLTPLVGHLEQAPEEKFRTTMMMIQAADDHTLLRAAFEAAQQITDEKVRAQALLDVVNEINYFTQQQA